MVKFFVAALLLVALMTIEFGQSLKCYKCDTCGKDKDKWDQQECGENERCHKTLVMTMGPIRGGFNRRGCVGKETRCENQYNESNYYWYYDQTVPNRYNCPFCDNEDLCNYFPNIFDK